MPIAAKEHALIEVDLSEFIIPWESTEFPVMPPEEQPKRQLDEIEWPSIQTALYNKQNKSHKSSSNKSSRASQQALSSDDDSDSNGEPQSSSDESPTRPEPHGYKETEEVEESDNESFDLQRYLYNIDLESRDKERELASSPRSVQQHRGPARNL